MDRCIDMPANTELEFQNAIHNGQSLSGELEIWMIKAHGEKATNIWRQCYAACHLRDVKCEHGSDQGAESCAARRKAQLLDAAVYWRASGDVENQQSKDGRPYRQSGQWPEQDQQFLFNLRPEYITAAKIPDDLKQKTPASHAYWKRRLLADKLRMAQIAQAEGPP
ncbi:uncharacterized protein RHO25_006990 [Cercospora beticola]|uniref:Uncharacterized protein n=1 Tax=Cercospora beticola TaxID=122368 RepID=A0ABZ0NS49_CERBT|nr:hypothetical protein RHO25_006990 [Cercospora beticola]CAK1362759.1 unnamed protein product [Cercospora beticola]